MEKKYKEPRKKSFQLFYDNVDDMINEFNDEEVGILFKAIASYELYGDIPTFSDRSLKMVFNQFRGNLDRNMDKFISTCERNRDNRNKGGRTSDDDTKEKELRRQAERDEIETLLRRNRHDR